MSTTSATITTSHTAGTGTPIKNIQQLREYLQVALQLEHATLPPYLTTTYTARLESNKPSIDIVKTVAKEEMLHLTLAANLLNAIGGAPDLMAEGFVPTYPTPLPCGETDFKVSIQRFSDQAVDNFLQIERPAQPEAEDKPLLHKAACVTRVAAHHVDESIRDQGFIQAVPTDGHFDLHYDIAFIASNRLSDETQETRKDCILPTYTAKDEEGNEIELHYWSIGEFYKAIHLGFVHVAQQMGEKELFCGDIQKQVPLDVYFSAGGELTIVHDLKTALAAIDLIAGQGEGAQGRIYDDEGELSHYYRFDQIRQRRYYRTLEQGGDEPGKPQGGVFPVDMAAVYPIKKDAKVADYAAHPELHEHALLFNGQYRRFLHMIHEAFNGKPELLRNVFQREMFAIKVAMERLIHNPIAGTGENATPTFEMDQYK